MKISILIPVYNEEKTIKLTLDSVQKSFLNENYEIIVINDGSTDLTNEILSNYLCKNIKIIQHNKNLGKGRSIINGINVSNSDYIAIQDADLEYRPETLYELWRNILNKDTVIFGKRSGKDGYLMNRLGNKVLNFVCNFLFKSNLSDIYTCYKIIPTSLIRSLNLKSNGFEIEAEITAKLLAREIEILEVPISYLPRKFSDGKKIRWIDGLRGIVKLVKIYFEGNP